MNTEFARRQMVEQQVRAWDVFDVNVLNVMQSVERDQFVPRQYVDVAYADTEIPIGHGQHMMTPIVEGRLLQALALKPDETVLEIGTGSAYLTACLAELAGHVTSIDLFEEFIDRATSVTGETGIDNVSLMCMDCMAELPEGEFDAIAVTGSLPHPYLRLLDKLKPMGRMFVVIGKAPVMEAQIVTGDADGAWHAETLFETRLGRLLNVPVDPPFRF